MEWLDMCFVDPVLLSNSLSNADTGFISRLFQICIKICPKLSRDHAHWECFNLWCMIYGFDGRYPDKMSLDKIYLDKVSPHKILLGGMQDKIAPFANVYCLPGWTYQCFISKTLRKYFPEWYGHFVNVYGHVTTWWHFVRRHFVHVYIHVWWHFVPDLLLAPHSVIMPHHLHPVHTLLPIDIQNRGKIAVFQLTIQDQSRPLYFWTQFLLIELLVATSSNNQRDWMVHSLHCTCVMLVGCADTFLTHLVGQSWTMILRVTS